MIHRSSVGTYHPNPKSDIAWTIHDSRGYIDSGPTCDECDACDCWHCIDDDDHACKADHLRCQCDCLECYSDINYCIGLSFAYVCLDGGATYCEECKPEEIEITECDC